MNDCRFKERLSLFNIFMHATLLLYLFSNVKSQLFHFTQLVSQQQTVATYFKSSNRNAILEFKNVIHIEIIGF